MERHALFCKRPHMSQIRRGSKKKNMTDPLVDKLCAMMYPTKANGRGELKLCE